MSKTSRLCTAFELEDAMSELAPHAVPYVVPAFRGDVGAARMLAVALDNQDRGDVAVRMWAEKVERPAFREFLSAVWDHDHAYLIDAAGTHRRLAAMFRYAAFPLPELPGSVQVWRGAFDVTARQAAAGYSWTLDRDTACWFACYPSGQVPVVVTAHIELGQIVYFSNQRQEQEVLLMTPPRWRIDSDASDWRAGHARRVGSVRQRQENFLKSRTATAPQAA